MLKPLLCTVFIVSCGTVPKLDVDTIYKREMGIEIDSRGFEGVASVPVKESYRIELRTPQKPDLLKISTCHRDMPIKKPGKEYSFQYVPVEREKLVPCPMEIVALDAKGENSWALIDFVSSKESLTARIGCNSRQYTAVGSSVCQSKVGLIQTIDFSEDVTAASPDRCPELTKISARSYEYASGEGSCQYLFYNGKELFRLVTFGYSEVLLYD